MLCGSKRVICAFIPGKEGENSRQCLAEPAIPATPAGQPGLGTSAFTQGLWTHQCSAE